MSAKQDSLDLTPLENDYEILGEFGGQADARTFTARRKDGATKRRDDATGVLITVLRPPEGDEGNALSHMAADAKMLAASNHRRLMPVIDGRWLGNDAFALITLRTSDETLGQKFATREPFSNPRIAALLREVNGLLEWAREHNVVHREVSVNRIFLEPKTDRVRVSFGVSSIPRVRNVDAATADARTIVRLAMAMLLGQDDPTLYETQCLADLRSDLPVRLCEASTALLDVKQTHTPDEVHSFISLIGMADPLFVGEEEANRLRADVHEEARILRETIANEREEHERRMIDERDAFETEMANQRAAFEQLMASERGTAANEEAERQRVAAAERDRVANEKAELQRAALAERAALVAKAADLERAIAERRAEVERVALEDRRKIETLRAEMLHAGEAELEARRQRELDEMPVGASALEQTDLASLPFVPPVIVPLEKLVFDNDSVLMHEDEGEDSEAHLAAVGAGEDDALMPGTRESASPGRDAQPTKRKWYVPAALAAMVAVIGATAVVLNARGTTQAPPAAPVAAPVAAVALPPVASAPPSLVPLPAFVVDSSAGMAAPALDSNGNVVRMPVARRARPVVRDTVATSDSIQGGEFLPVPGFLPPAPRDTVVRRSPPARPRVDPR